MRPVEKLVALLILVALLGCVSAITKLLGQPAPAPVPVERVHLPSDCAKYYNDGTDRWINCMGVEKK